MFTYWSYHICEHGPYYLLLKKAEHSWSKCVALEVAVELIESLIYKLRMFIVPIEDKPRVLCDKEVVVNSNSYPESSLKKKHSSVAYHMVQEAVAESEWLIIIKIQN